MAAAPEKSIGRRGASVTIQSFTKRFQDVVAVDDVTLEIPAGEFLALLGPSGSGKSTILMGIAGFEHPTTGRVAIGGEDCTLLPANRRNVGMVFQRYTLFPHLKVIDNVAFPLKMRGVAKAERRAKAEAALATVRLAGYGNRMPAQLSGGQQQRVALARAIVYEPRVLLMDEPLSALDRNLREEMQLEIKRLHDDLGLTVVFVTHDQGEALTMSDRIAVLNEGRVQQVGTPRELYQRPENLFVARFIGEMNVLNGMMVTDAGRPAVRLAAGRTCSVPPEALAGAVAPGEQCLLCVRPERVRIVRPDEADAIPVTIADIVYAGAAVLVIAAAPDGTEMRARVPGAADVSDLQPGESAGFALPADGLLVYPAKGSGAAA
jgi:putative spermidine/putrescine transport system ATP-binding protein/mannopine transport system ATP-binding protein